MPAAPAVEPRGRKPADAAADHDEIVALLERRSPTSGKRRAYAQRVGGLERARRAARAARSAPADSATGCAATCAAGVRPAAIVSATPLRKSRREIEDMRAEFSNPAPPASRRVSAFAARPAYPTASSPCGCGLVAARRGTISFASRTWTTSPHWLRVSLRTFTIPRSGRERGDERPPRPRSPPGGCRPAASASAS